MSETKDWETEKFNEVFSDDLRLLSRRREHDPSCTILDLEGILKSLYIIDGNNWEGRSNIQQIALDATIAAYEKFIDDWKNEKKRSTDGKKTHN